MRLACLGTFVESKAISPISHESLDDRQLDWADIFELLKTREVVWGGQVYAVPLGSPVLVCFYREDLLSGLGLSPPRTWEDYRDVAAALATLGKSQSAHDPDISDSSAQSTAWSDDRAARCGLGRVDAVGSRSGLRATCESLFDAVQHADDGTAGGFSAICARSGGVDRGHEAIAGGNN